MPPSAPGLDFCERIAPVSVPTPYGGATVDLRARRDGTIGTVTIPAGSLLSLPGGRLGALVPPSDLPVGSCVFRAGTAITFRHGRVAGGVLAKEVEIGGIPCAAGYHLRLAYRTPDAPPTLYTATLARDVEISGVPCAGGRHVVLYGTELASAYLSRSFVAGGIRFRAGTSLSGVLPSTPRAGTLDEDCDVDGVPCGAGSEIRLSPRLQPTAFTLSRDHRIDGVPCLAGQCIQTRSDADGFRYVLAAPYRRRSIGWHRGDVLYGETIRALKARLASPLRLGGAEVPAGSDVEFESSFFLRCAVKFAAPIEVGGQHFETGSWAVFRCGRWERAWWDRAP
jgi:hypothetical protein